MLLLNTFAPTTSDVRVVNYVVPIVSQVRGRVIEVPVQNNQAEQRVQRVNLHLALGRALRIATADAGRTTSSSPPATEQ